MRVLLTIPPVLGVTEQLTACSQDPDALMSARLSGVQREVNHLYRRILRAARVKDGGLGSTTELVRAEFREQARSSVSKRSVAILSST